MGHLSTVSNCHVSAKTTPPRHVFHVDPVWKTLTRVGLFLERCFPFSIDPIKPLASLSSPLCLSLSLSLSVSPSLQRASKWSVVVETRKRGNAKAGRVEDALAFCSTRSGSGAVLMAIDLRTFGLPSRAAMEEDDDAVELCLGLSVGGSVRKVGGCGAGHMRQDLELGSGEAEAGRLGSGASMSSSSTQSPLGFPQGDLADAHDPHRRRDMHVVRRQDARKRRRERQKKKGSVCVVGEGVAAGARFCGSSPSREETCLGDDQVALVAQEKLWRVRDRDAKVEEARHFPRRAGENNERDSDFVRTPELCSNANANPSTCSSPNPSISPNFSNTNLLPLAAAHPFPLIAMQYPYPLVQYAPMANGFGFPYVMPCWSPMMSSLAGGPNPASNVFQPVACRTFQPFWAPDVEPTSGASPLLSSKLADSSGGNGGTIKQTLSRTGSLGSSSSSAISDYQSNSLQAGGSSGSDIRSHSSLATAEISHPQLSGNNLVRGQSERSTSPPHVEPPVVDAVLEAPPETERPSSNSPESAAEVDPIQSQCAATKVDGAAAVNESAPTADDESTPRPPLPAAPLPRMPCVSTTGNGPNGRTVTGFLYRYSSTEVCIVCVCHGSSFSAAEFVKHAGGTDVDNPLRHIVVTPS